MGNIAIKVDHVSKTFKLPHEKNTSIKSAVVNFRKRKRGYNKQQVLHDISFNVKEGEFFAIVGRNGSGKSTLLKMLAGIYEPDKGTIVTNGKLIPFIELGVGFNPELSGRENVYLNGALLGFNRKEMEAMYGDIVEFAELERFMDQKLKNYSSGMQVRLAFSIAIRAKGDILLLDEVLAVGDGMFQQKCFDYFEELKRQKKTVVFVSHDMGAVKRFCTKAIYVKNGRIVNEGSPTEIVDMYMADTLEGAHASAFGVEESTGYSVVPKITKQTNDKVVLEISYESASKEDMYIGISVIRDGASVAEITTSPKMPLKGSGKVSYTLDTKVLNPGVYEVTAVICQQRNRELKSFSRDKVVFIMKGHDITKGGAIRLADTWKHVR